MYKALLVDDDEMERRGLANLSVFPRCAVQIAAEARNGQQALELAEKIKPDIVISDVRMPIMDGLECTRRLKKRFPEIHIIMMSGFEDFNAAQQSLAIGADAYLTKPLSAQELEYTLIRVTEHINANADSSYETERLQARMENLRPLLRERILRDLLLGVRPFDKATRIEAKEAGLFAHEEKLAVLLIKVETTPAIGYTPSAMLGIQDALAGMLRALTLSEPIAIYGDLFAAIAYLPRRMDDETAFDHLQQCAAYMLTRMREQSGYDATIAISEVMDDEACLGLMYTQALNTLKLNTFYGINRVYWHDSDESEPVSTDLSVPAKEIYRCLRTENEEMARAAIAAFFNTIRKDEASGLERPVPVEQVQAILCGLVAHLLLLSAGEGQPLLGGGRYQPELLFAHIIKTTRMDELQAYVTEWLIQNNKYLQRKQSHAENLVQQVIAYIREHYANDISAERIARDIFITPAHLRRLFKNVTGKTVQDCVLTHRMNRARELLRTTEMKIAEVSRTVGYDNPSYFNIVFKKYYGIAPGEYRYGDTNL